MIEQATTQREQYFQELKKAASEFSELLIAPSYRRIVRGLDVTEAFVDKFRIFNSYNQVPTWAQYTAALDPYDDRMDKIGAIFPTPNRDLDHLFLEIQISNAYFLSRYKMFNIAEGTAHLGRNFFKSVIVLGSLVFISLATAIVSVISTPYGVPDEINVVSIVYLLLPSIYIGWQLFKAKFDLDAIQP